MKQLIRGIAQLALLRDLTASMADTRTSEEACRRSAAALAADPRDIAFAMIYLASGGEAAPVLKGLCEIERGHPAAPELLAKGASAWPMMTNLHDADQVIDLAQHSDAEFPSGPWSKPPRHAVILPLSAASDAGCQGVLIVGLDTFRMFDDKYRSFLKLVAGQITAAIANAEAYRTNGAKRKPWRKSIAPRPRSSPTSATIVSHPSHSDVGGRWRDRFPARAAAFCAVRSDMPRHSRSPR